MAFQLPNIGQERQNRKILEELQEQKKRLRMQTVTAAATGSTPSVTPVTATTNSTNSAASTNSSLPQSSFSESQHMTPAQRTALQHAHANSVGYFVTQDSSFGNLILPVLPRFDMKTSNTS